jgi:Fic family protein
LGHPGRAGKYVTQQPRVASFKAFVPASLPITPALRLTAELQDKLERSNRAIGRLDGLSRLLPDPQLFLYMYIRKEAVLSSQIEGTQSSLSDLLMFEETGTPGVPLNDVQEVSRYVAALEHGLTRLRGGFPLSLRLLREIHGVLMTDARGGDKTPGEFRTSQNWIGGTHPGNAAYVPPPPHEMQQALDNLEKFLHDQYGLTPLLLKAGIVHAQFETIHPFLDGNGRLGRLLITFLLVHGGALSQPLLYLSLYLKEKRDQYYASLQAVRDTGDWEQWLSFFLDGVEVVATQATETASRVLALFEADRIAIQAMGKTAISALKVHDYLRHQALASGAALVKSSGLSLPTVLATLDKLRELKIVREITGQARNRVFVYDGYIDILNAGVAAVSPSHQPVMAAR